MTCSTAGPDQPFILIRPISPSRVAATGTLLNGHASDEGDANSITTFEPIRCRDTSSAVTATSSVSSVPIDFIFLGMTIPSAHEAVNTICRYANCHQFPLYRSETSYDPSKHAKRRKAAPHPRESQPSLMDIADLLKSVSSEYPAKKARIMIAVEKSFREIIDSATADSE
ncbi:hypothetical protein BGZ73_007254 [Actinomortierella ambigua]|nr:hypothetical protein BGZ73_007254 [Actinomortierella ambigua]